MIRAQGYTPAIVYVEAGANLKKHMAVRLSYDAIAVPADQAADTKAMGFALQDALAGDFVPVQTDGVIYDWEGTAILIPGREYYQSVHGNISTAVSGYAWPVGVAINSTTFQIRIGSVGSGVSGQGMDIYEDYIYIQEEDISNQYVDLDMPFYDIQECLAVVLGGGSLHLIPDVDYFLDMSSPMSYVYDRVSWVGLPKSILLRACPNDMITLTRKGEKVEASDSSIVFLSNGTVIAEAPAILNWMHNGVQVGVSKALRIKQFSS